MATQLVVIIKGPKTGGINTGIFNEVDMQRAPEVIPLEDIKDLSAREYEAYRRKLRDEKIDQDFNLK